MKTLTAALLLIFASSFAEAQNKPPGTQGGHANPAVRGFDDERDDMRSRRDTMSLATAMISARQAREIAVRHSAIGTKPLPYGIRKKLARGKPMPPGIQKTRMPGAVLDDLPLQPGYRWLNAGTDLLLVQAGTGIVADILEDVFE